MRPPAAGTERSVVTGEASGQWLVASGQSLRPERLFLKGEAGGGIFGLKGLRISAQGKAAALFGRTAGLANKTARLANRSTCPGGKAAGVFGRRRKANSSRNGA